MIVQRLDSHQITQAKHQLLDEAKSTVMKDVSFKVKQCMSTLQA